METITFYRLLDLFKDRKTLNKLNKGNFIVKKLAYNHDKSSKGHNVHFYFETPNFENFFTIIVKLNSFDGYGNDDIELYLLAGYTSGFVSKRIPNTYDDFFKTFIQLRDEYIEYRGEFKESNKKEYDKENQANIEKQKQLDKMKNTLDKYL